MGPAHQHLLQPPAAPSPPWPTAPPPSPAPLAIPLLHRALHQCAVAHWHPRAPSPPGTTAMAGPHRRSSTTTSATPSPPFSTYKRRARACASSHHLPHPFLACSVAAAEPSTAATAVASPSPDLLPRRLSTAGEHTSPLLSIYSFHFASSRTPRSTDRCQFWPAMAALSADHGVQEMSVTTVKR
jgi:hypothetical protein